MSAVLIRARLALSLAVALVAAVLVVAPSPGVAAAESQQVRPLPTGTDVDYQLGGTRSVPPRVGVVVRDRRASPVPGRYNVCYVNGFQTQPDERRFWRDRMHLVLRRDGSPVVDSAWGEWLLDIRTPAKRRQLADIVGRWTAGCAADGFDAVEFDNLDSYTRSRRMLTRAQAVSFARLLVASAHASGLAAGQKNLADFDGTRVGYDFAVAEECGRYTECGAYVRHHGRRVLVVEYRARDFRRACATHGPRLAIVLRDRALRPNGVRRWC